MQLGSKLRALPVPEQAWCLGGEPHVFGWWAGRISLGFLNTAFPFSFELVEGWKVTSCPTGNCLWFLYFQAHPQSNGFVFSSSRGAYNSKNMPRLLLLHWLGVFHCLNFSFCLMPQMRSLNALPAQSMGKSKCKDEKSLSHSIIQGKETLQIFMLSLVHYPCCVAETNCTLTLRKCRANTCYTLRDLTDLWVQVIYICT